MISALVCVPDDRLKRELLRIFREQTADLTEDGLRFTDCALTPEECDKLLREKPLLDMIVCDITEEGALDCLERLREEYAAASILLVAGREQSPLSYLRPRIRASSLLLKPCGGALLRAVTEEFLRSWLEEHAGGGGSLVIKSEDGRLNIPCRRIYYVEAREKKLYVRLKGEEYSFYGSLDRLQEELPESFVRSHRSFLVNKGLIEKIRLSEQLIELRDGFVVPISRSCRAKLRELKL